MKKSIYFLLLLSSCSANHAIVGLYSLNGHDFKESLDLKKNKTFTLSYEAFETKSQCHGKWKYLTKDTILLHCDTEYFPDIISSGYMSKRMHKIVVIDKNHIKYEQIILNKSEGG